MQSARTLRSHIFIWTCGWRGIALGLALPPLRCTVWIHMWFMPGPVSWPYHITCSDCDSYKLLQCIFAYDWHPFRFSCIVFWAPKCGQLASRSRSVVSTHTHTHILRYMYTIYRCTARQPLLPSPRTPLAFRMLSLFDAADFGFICSLLAEVYVAFKWVIEQMDVRYACLPTYEYNHIRTHTLWTE